MTLTGAQIAALDKLALNHVLWVDRGRPKIEKFTLPPYVRANTLEALATRGLVEVSYLSHGNAMAHITEAGWSQVRQEKMP